MMIRFRSIRARVLIILTVTIVAVSITMFTYLLHELKSKIFATFDSVIQTMNTMLVQNVRGYVYYHDDKQMQFFIDSIHSEYIGDILILDPDGHVIARKSALASGGYYPRFEMLRKAKSVRTTELYAVMTVFELLDVPLGYLVIEGNLEHYRNEVGKESRELLVSAALMVFLAFAVAYYLALGVSRPLYRMIRTLEQTGDNEVLRFANFGEREYRYLAKTIRKKHNAVLRLNAHLEEEVADKTGELRQLNEQLEDKVKQAVEEIRLKEKLLQQQSRLAQMGEMISMIAHQWRQPLGAVTATLIGIETRLAMKKYDLSTEAGRTALYSYLDGKMAAIREYVGVMTETIEDFRTFFRKESRPERDTVDNAIRRALHIAGASFTSREIEIVEAYGSTRPICLYRNELMQVVLNVMKNSDDAFVEQDTRQRRITLRTRDDETGVVIEICDNAGGVPEAVAPKVFDPYFSTKSEKNGTGLGLYMSKMIIEEHHGGTLRLYNRDSGACMEIILPEKRSECGE